MQPHCQHGNWMSKCSTLFHPSQCDIPSWRDWTTLLLPSPLHDFPAWRRASSYLHLSVLWENQAFQGWILNHFPVCSPILDLILASKTDLWQRPLGRSFTSYQVTRNQVVPKVGKDLEEPGLFPWTALQPSSSWKSLLWIDSALMGVRQFWLWGDHGRFRMNRVKLS